MSPLKTVIIFTADGCPHSRALRADLERRGVRFRERNLSRDPEALGELREWSWEHRVPVVVDHERVTVGFNGGSSSFEEVGVE